MKNTISRRKFLKNSILTACSVAAINIPEVKASNIDKRLATLHDLSKCTGCGACVEACKEVNSNKFPDPAKPFPKMFPERVPVMDWSEKQDITDRLTPYNWLFIQSTVVEHNGREIEVNIPRRCMHCVNPPCVKLCPWGAAKQLENGLSRIDSSICLGGSKCKAVCPWKIPERQTGVGLYLDILPALVGNGVMYKCDRCYNRLANNEIPACIEECPEGVQTIGPRDEIIKNAHNLAKKINGYIYGEKENGGTNTIYVSPVPFEKIDKSIAKGAGKPYLGHAKDAMADGNNISMAMLLAPVAGIAAAAGKYYNMTKNKNNPL